MSILSRNRLISPFILVVAGTLLYNHTLDIPWYLDDFHAIVENPIIHDFQFSLKSLISSRGLPNLSFALNYIIGGTDPFGYHIVNIVLHIINSILVYYLLQHLFKKNYYLAFCGALLFLIHPVQTQSVNYIVQRSVLIAALFALLSIILYMKAAGMRSSHSFRNPKHCAYFILSLLFFLLSVSSKQNTATLPIILYLLDTLIINKSQAKKNLVYIAPFILIPSLFAVKIILLPYLSGKSMTAIGNVRALSNLENLSPLTYFATELEVIFTYIRLFIFPINLKLDYAYPLAQNVFTFWNFCLLVIHIAIILIAVYLKDKKPLFACGVLWFYLALVVESTFIPLDPIFEHRLYFPIIGLIFCLCSVIENIAGRKIVLVVSILIVSALSILTFNRNDLWREPIAFTEDNARKAPHSEGVMLSLSYMYLKENRLEEAASALNKALAINPDYPLLYINLSSVLIKKRELEKASKVTIKGLQLLPNNSKLLRNLSQIHSKKGQHLKAIDILTKLLAKHPEDPMLYGLVGQNLLDLGRWAEAEEYLLEAIKRDSKSAAFFYSLGISQYRQKKYTDAIKSLEATVSLNPSDTNALLGLGFIALETGDRAKAGEILNQLKPVDPRGAAQLQNAILKTDN